MAVAGSLSIFSPVSLVQRETNVKYIPQQLGHGNIGIMLDLYSYLFHPSTQGIDIMYESNHGGVTERPNVPVLKTGDPLRGPRVQISPPPPCFLLHTDV